MNRPPISRLDVFLAIAQHGSLRRAAVALGVQPPAISYQLRALEGEIGFALFTRTTRSIQLTEPGRTLLKRIQPVMAELSDALEEARVMGKVKRGAIRLTLPYIA